MTDPLTELEGLVALAELEQIVRFAEEETGQSIPDAHRPLTDPERQARTMFGIIEAAITASANQIATIADDVWAATIAELTALMDGQHPNIPSLLAALYELTSPVSTTIPEPVLAAQRAAAALILDQLNLAHYTGALIAMTEAHRQGAVGPVDSRFGWPSPQQQAMNQVAAQRIAAQPTERSYQAATRAVDQAKYFTPNPASLGVTVIVALQNVDHAGTAALAKAAASTSHGNGRADAINAVPAEVKTLYSSELMDSATCRACAAVDGTRYPSFDAALADYPGGGGYRSCEGGANCRGTLVAVYDEARALDSPPAAPAPAAGQVPPDRFLQVLLDHGYVDGPARL